MLTIQIISKDELNQDIQHGKPIQIVNALSPDKYVLGMIKNSIKIPLGELDARTSELDKNIDVVTYCANSHCPVSKQAAELLANKGFRVRAYEGGIEEWTQAGLPTESPDDAVKPLAEKPAEADAPSGLSGLPTSPRNGGRY